VTICSVCTSGISTCVPLNLSKPNQMRQDSLHRDYDRFGNSTELVGRLAKLQHHRQTSDRGGGQAILPSESDSRVILRTDNPAALGQLRRQLADDPAFWWLVEASRQGSGKLLLPLRKGDPTGHDRRRYTARPTVEQGDEVGYHIAERDRPPRIGSMITVDRRPNQTHASDLKGEL
jgi:hypothetical protein